MPVWEQRMDLAIRGWSTDVRIGTLGMASSPPSEIGFSIWAKRWHWAGGVSEICLHAHTDFNLDIGNGRSRIEACVAKLHDGCLRAVADFPDSVPYQMSGMGTGRIELGFNESGTKQWDRNRNVHPTEKLLGDASLYAGQDDHVDQLVETGMQRMHIEPY